MSVVSINVPEEILLYLHEDKNDFAKYLKKMLAIDLYKNRKISLGYCSDVAEKTKEEFVRILGINGVSIFSFDSEEEFSEELKNAQGSGKFNFSDCLDSCREAFLFGQMTGDFEKTPK